ncbi:hypothetical protein HK099_002854 [Clydaea vesicula]|uniref:LicD/FKTN/FKRP nucleotidyltransferase domain-containing protein n=1 Tax=Clydaea vesicula TaxID=447962 RepID=A0AAD5Y0J4_9FUNG|nr:hypothetical protein HK099_002854 [Clydaea vesicula]
MNISNFNNYDPKQENYLKLSWDLFEKFETDINFDLTNLEDQPKYYQILKEDTHRDSRFSFRSINPAERIQTLRGILKNWVEFNQDIGIVTWINHGPLLGWYWNKQLFPWDADLDFQISPHHYEILKKYNQTIINENYLVDLNPYYLDRRAWGFNVIDGRFENFLFSFPFK